MKKKFYIIAEQDNRGCDYTIGCGISASMEEDVCDINSRAKELAGLPEDWREQVDNNELDFEEALETFGLNENDENPISNWVIIESVKEVNLLEIRNKSIETLEEYFGEVSKKKIEEKERAEYKRLKKKYG